MVYLPVCSSVELVVCCIAQIRWQLYGWMFSLGFRFSKTFSPKTIARLLDFQSTVRKKSFFLLFILQIQNYRSCIPTVVVHTYILVLFILFNCFIYDKDNAYEIQTEFNLQRPIVFLCAKIKKKEKGTGYEKCMVWHPGTTSTLSFSVKSTKSSSVADFCSFWNESWQVRRATWAAFWRALLCFSCNQFLVTDHTPSRIAALSAKKQSLLRTFIFEAEINKYKRTNK